MKVFKFDGSGIGNMDRIAEAGNILKNHSGQQILVVIPAMGKTAGALEKVAEAFYNGHREEALALFETVKKSFLTLANYLLVKGYNEAYTCLLDIFTEVEWLLHDRPVKDFDYYYDQIVCSGGLLSSAIVSAYFNEAGIQNIWVDIRDIVRTDNHFRDASIDWSFTRERIDAAIIPLFNTTDLVITQGSTGATAENESVTLGKEGGDYSAAVFAHMLNASELTIWKDTEGITNADPKTFPGAIVIPKLNYEEAAGMTYYGAQAIHPKTIQLLQNKNIPLRIKCFLDQDLPGTVISDRQTPDLPH